ncbi:MAG: type II secretion system protein GspD [Lentisphaerae bacterium]|nr:type II secretion system protein GspD [Lentisphaerota bacterium]
MKTTPRAKRRRIAAVCLAMLLRAGLMGQPGQAAPEDEQVVPRLKFNNATLDIVLEDYSEKTGRTLLRAPNLPNVLITLQSVGDLTLDEYLQAIEAVLSMNQIGLLKVGEKFLRVVPIKQARQEAMALSEPGAAARETDGLISQMIPLRHITVAEAQKTLEGLTHPFADVRLFERINSVLLTDTEANVARIVEVLAQIDQPVPALEEPHVVPILHAKAGEIKAKLEEIIADAQKDQQSAPSTVPRPRQGGPPGVEAPLPGIPGVIRPPVPAPAAPESTVAELVAMAERGVIRGKVKIVADERTNVLIIITRPENMIFFEKIIRVLDVATEPDVVVRILRMEYADAEAVAGSLNTLIGEAQKGAETGAPPKEGEQKGGALTEYVEKLRAERAAAGAPEKSKIGELSAANVKILPDKRTNSLLIMASRADYAAIEELVRSMDIMLSQVMIEVVIFKIGLTDERERGIDWVQRALVAYEGEGGRRSPVMAFAGAGGGEADRKRMANPLTARSLGDLTGAAGNLTYYFTFFDLNLDAIVRLVASDGRSEIVASPTILTTDNKEASINVTKEKYFFKGLKFVSGTGESGQFVDDVEMRKIGTKLTVTPRINEKRFVVMEITQSFEEEGAGQRVVGAAGPADWPTVDSSELTAAVAVRSGETIVLGGLVSSGESNDKDRIPVVGDIPLIGRLFQWVKDTGNKSEIVVFITPYVLDTPEDIEAETERRRENMAVDAEWPVSSGSRILRKDEERRQEAERLRRQSEEDRRRAPWNRRAEPDGKPAAEAAPATGSGAAKAAAPAQEPQPPPPPAAEAQPAPAAEEWPIDPELQRLIDDGERRWGRQLQRIDRRIEAVVEETAE